MSDASFSTVFSQALRGEPCHVEGLEPEPTALPVEAWTRPADDDDHTLLALCVGATLDIGCGPGRMTAALADLGQVVLGIDVVGEAVGLTRERGGSALRRDVFDHLPGEGRWRSALLADGNVGIGGDPHALLKRIRQLIDPRGRVVVELARPGLPASTGWARLVVGEERSRPFRWSVVGVDAIDELASSVGLAVTSVQQHGERWSAVLEEQS
ncbi:MAG: class I SAM-dependent methyltransferase [Nocardioides sp.]